MNILLAIICCRHGGRLVLTRRLEENMKLSGVRSLKNAYLAMVAEAAP